MSRKENKRAGSRAYSPLGYSGRLIPVAVAPAVRMTLVHVGTAVIPPARIEARAVIIGVAPVVVALPVRRAADINSETRALKVDALRHGSCCAGRGNRADEPGGDD